jgi:hypothetical protein
MRQDLRLAHHRRSSHRHSLPKLEEEVSPGHCRSKGESPAASSGQRSTELFNRVMDDVLVAG